MTTDLRLRAGYGGEIYIECRTCDWYEEVSDLPLSDVVATGERHACNGAGWVR